MVRRSLVSVIAFIFSLPLTLSAQRLGTVDVGVYGQFTRLDESLPIDNGPGVGGRLGFFLHRLVSVEGSIGYSFLQTTAGASVGHVPWRGRLMFHAPAASSVAILLGGGLVHNQYVNEIEGSDNGVTGALGLRLGLTDAVFIRAEGIGDYMSFPTNEAQGASNNLNIGVQLGMAVHFSALGGGGRVIAEEPADQPTVAPETPAEAPPAPMDTDGDGVVDRDDRCPNTPGGQAVDAFGCLPDDDGDGVPNMRDRCANTAGGTTVDANGCAVRMDADGDGVEDTADRCPDTPAGTNVDATGCPQTSDADGDGIADSLDQCPGTPRGTTVDATGCPPPADSDGDGVPDPRDQCPDTPPGAGVNASGCSAPTDSDGDGVADTIDQCSGTAAGISVDAMGCPIQTDADGDGVLDAADQCPNTPAGTRVDATGCPIAEPTPTPTVTRAPVILQGVTFISNSAGITSRVAPILDRVADSLMTNPGGRIEVAGHTDDRGDRAENVELSQQRAQAVVDYLVSRGVSRDRLVARGYGPDQPLADNESREGRLRNRRVELRDLGN